jgi:hypothetical protein
MRLSVVVVAHDMARELPRTLRSLSTPYQRQIAADDYEVIVVDNGSREPFDLGSAPDLPPHWRLIRIDPAPPSPAQAMNVGLRAARGDVVGMMIDGARMATPGLLHFALAGTTLAPRPVVTTLSWNLGWDSVQHFAIGGGYDPRREDELLDGLDWFEDGYRMFEIGAPTTASAQGWFQDLAETNALFMPAQLWHELGGVDERFDLPAGGFVNLDLLRRALEMPDTTQVVLLGEATFHQVHGDLEKRSDPANAAARGARWRAQYAEITGREWVNPRPQRPRMYVGELPATVLLHATRAALEPMPGRPHPLGKGFDQALWASPKAEPTGDKTVDAVVELARRQFRWGHHESAAAVCRAARSRLGEVPELMRILSLSSAWLTTGKPPRSAEVLMHCALGELHELLGDPPKAEAEFRLALDLDGAAGRAASGLARLRMPGPDYSAVLTRLHGHLKPPIYLEIGVATGSTLVLAQPPTITIGIDPNMNLEKQVRTTSYLFPLLSDDFFEEGHAAHILGARRIDFAFIDGLHHFDQVLRDFANVERWSTPETVVVFHDTVPVDERSQERDRSTSFWTGDVWKAMAALRSLRPDLDIFTAATWPSGLTFITRLDPSSTIVTDKLDRIVATYMDLPYSEVAARLPDLLEIIPADWPTVQARLERARGGSLVGSAAANGFNRG